MYSVVYGDGPSAEMKSRFTSYSVFSTRETSKRYTTNDVIVSSPFYDFFWPYSPDTRSICIPCPCFWLNLFCEGRVLSQISDRNKHCYVGDRRIQKALDWSILRNMFSETIRKRVQMMRTSKYGSIIVSLIFYTNNLTCIQRDVITVSQPPLFSSLWLYDHACNRVERVLLKQR